MGTTDNNDATDWVASTNAPNNDSIGWHKSQHPPIEGSYFQHLLNDIPLHSLKVPDMSI